MLRALKWTIIIVAGLVAIIIMLPLGLVVASLTYNKFVPSDQASVYIPQVNATVQVELYVNNPIGRAEYDRQLVVKTPNGKVKHELFLDWGGASRLNLYLAENGQLVIIAATAATYFISTQPLSVSGRGDLSNSDRWTFLGAFARGTGAYFTLEYYPVGKISECIPLLGMTPSEVSSDPSKRPREHAYKQSC